MFRILKKRVFVLLDKVKGSPIERNLDMLEKYDTLNYNDEIVLIDRRNNKKYIRNYVRV